MKAEGGSVTRLTLTRDTSDTDTLQSLVHLLSLSVSPSLFSQTEDEVRIKVDG